GAGGRQMRRRPQDMVVLPRERIGNASLCRRLSRPLPRRRAQLAASRRSALPPGDRGSTGVARRAPADASLTGPASNPIHPNSSIKSGRVLVADKLIIFDCDGVLVDSEPLAAEAYERVYGRHGMNGVGADIIAQCIGLKQADIIVKIKE